MASRLPVYEDRWKALNYPSAQAYEQAMKAAEQRLAAKGIYSSTPFQPHATDPTIPPIGRLPAPPVSPAVPAEMHVPATVDDILVDGKPYAPPADTYAAPTASWQAAQDKANLEAGRLAGLLPAPLTQDTGAQLGAAYRASAAANAGPTNVHGYVGSRYDPAASANQTAGGNVRGYAGSRYDPNAYHNQQVAASTTPDAIRKRNIEAARAKIIDPSTGRTEFDEKREIFNKNNTALWMDEQGNIKPLTPDIKAANSSSAVADAKVATAQAKAAEVKAAEQAKLAKSEARGWTKALLEADRRDPVAVSSRLSAILTGEF